MLSSCGRKGFPSPHLLLPALLHLGQLLAAPGHAPELLLCIAVGFGTRWERGGVRVRGCSVPGTPVPLPTDTGGVPRCCGAERGGTLRTLSGVALLPVGCGDPPGTAFGARGPLGHRLLSPASHSALVVLSSALASTK